MEKLVVRYLNEKCQLNKLQKKHIGIYHKDTKNIYYGDYLLKDLSDIFDISSDDIKVLVNKWSKEDLDFYWTYKSITFLDIIPMEAPTGALHYLDYIYARTSERYDTYYINDING